MAPIEGHRVYRFRLRELCHHLSYCPTHASSLRTCFVERVPTRALDVRIVRVGGKAGRSLRLDAFLS